MFLTWMLQSFTEMNVTTWYWQKDTMFYERECYYMCFHKCYNRLRTWMLLLVTYMDVTNFYGYEWYYMLLTWMFLSLTYMNVTTFYWHECNYPLRKWMILHVTDMNVTTVNDMNFTIFTDMYVNTSY